MDQSAPALAVAHLEKSHGRVKALSRIDLTVGAGELVAILGLDGAGKSTLIELLAGLSVPDRGTIRVAGYDLRREPTRALAALGVVFQHQSLDPELTVRANLLYHCDLHGVERPTALRRIGEAVGRIDLAGRAGDRVRTLGAGNRRRVELARALLHRPRLLLLDDVTVGLDPASRKDILDDILRVKATEQVGILWTTHFADEVEAADRIVVLQRGRILFDGAPADLVAAQRVATVESAFLKMTSARRAESRTL